MKSAGFEMSSPFSSIPRTWEALICLFTALLLGPSASAAIRLMPGVPLLVPPSTPHSVRLAVADLQRDLQKVLGKASPIVEDPKDLNGQAAILIISDGASMPAWHDPAVSGREAHGIHLASVEGQSCIALEGADARGAIYAIYSFSDEFLDIPPLWYWIDWVPTQRKEIEIAADTRRIFPPAYVRWRAWLNNDTDFLSPWRSSKPANDQAEYETLLRLKYNTLEVGSIVDLRPEAPAYALQTEVSNASARGLVITHHHTSPLGSNLSSWSSFWRRQGQDIPALSVKDPEKLRQFWRYHVEAAHRAKLEVVWTLVFRGSRDIPYWETFADAPATTAERAKVLNEMLRLQASVVKEVTGNPAPDMRTTFYNEGSTLLASGLLHPPEEPTLIWNFVAARRDHFPTEDLRRLKPSPNRLIGYYLNFQFTSTGSHLAPAEGPWKMAENYRVADAAGSQPLAFTVVNAGNNREHLAELTANSAMMWRFSDFDADRFLENFCSRYYGKAHAAEIAALYRAYYESYWCQKRPDIQGFKRQYIFQDMRYARAVEMLLKDMGAKVHRPNPLDGHPLDNPDSGSVGYFRVELEKGDRTQVDALLRGTVESGRRFAEVAEQAEALRATTGQGETLFRDNLLVRAKLMASLNTMLRETALAYETQSDAGLKSLHLKAALSAAEAAQANLDETRHGSFQEWYSSDKHFDLAGLRDGLKGELERSH